MCSLSRLEDNANFFEIVNHVFNPHNAIEILFPLVAIIDSVFGAQLLLCLAFGGWLNAVMKWFVYYQARHTEKLIASWVYLLGLAVLAEVGLWRGDRLSR